MTRKAIDVLLGATFFLAPAVAAFAEPDADKGAALAADRCAGCHDVSPEGAFKEYPPSFASIAVYRSPEQIKGRMLYPQHASMPQLAFILLRDEVDDLIAYIVSLEAPARN